MTESKPKKFVSKRMRIAAIFKYLYEYDWLKGNQAVFYHDNKWNLNATDMFGCTPLCAAIFSENIEIFDGLLECGADANTKSTASQKYYMTTFSFKFTKSSPSLNSPLNHAIERNNLLMIQKLLSHGADPESGCGIGRPLTLAYYRSYNEGKYSFEKCELLLKYGANWTASLAKRDENGIFFDCRIFDVAVKVAVDEIVCYKSAVELFIQYGAKLPDHNVEQRYKTCFQKCVDAMAHRQIVDIMIALSTLKIPLYHLLDIMDWLPNFESVKRFQKVALMQNVSRSIQKVQH